MHYENIEIYRKYNNGVTLSLYLIGVWTDINNNHNFIGSTKSLNCVSIVNILSQQNILKTTSKISFDDVIVTSLHLSTMHYKQKIEHVPMINCKKINQVRIKTKKVMEEGGSAPPPPPPPHPWTERTQKSLDWIGLSSKSGHRTLFNKVKFTKSYIYRSPLLGVCISY